MMTINSIQPLRRIVFEGDSRMAQYNNGTDPQQYVPNTVYNTILASHPSSQLAMFSFAEGGRKLRDIVADAPTKVVPFVKQGDIIVLWEITNEMGPGGATAQECFDLLQDYSDLVRPLGAKLVVCTETARDKAGDDPNLLDDIFDCNQMIRDAGTDLCDVICDLGADSHFNTRSDCSNATYYDADKLHLTYPTGADVAANLISASILSLDF